MADMLLALADGDDFLVPTNPDRVEPELPDRPKEECVPSVLPYGWTAQAQAEFTSLKVRGAAMAQARGAAAAQEGTDFSGRPEQISYRPFRRFNRELLGVDSTGKPQACRVLERIANVLLGIRTDSLAEHPCWNQAARTDDLADLVAEKPWWLELQAMNRAFVTGILRARDPGADQLCSRICRIFNGQAIAWEAVDVGKISEEQARQDELNVLLHLLGIDDFPVSSGLEGSDGALPDYEDDMVEGEDVGGMTEEDFDDLFDDHDWDAPTSQESGQLFDPVETMLQNESISQDSTEPQEEAGPLAQVEDETEAGPVDAEQQRGAHVSPPFEPSFDGVYNGSYEAGPARKRRKRYILLTPSPPTRSSPPTQSDTLTSSSNTSSSSSSESSDSNNTCTCGPHCKCKCKSFRDSCDEHGRRYIIDAVAAAREAFRDDLAEALHDARENSRADFAEAFYQIRETHHTDIAEALNEAHESHSDTIAQALNIIRDNFIPEIIRGVEEVVNDDFGSALVSEFERRMGEQFNNHLGKLRIEALRYRRRERKLLDDAVNAVQRGERKIGKLHRRARAVYENAALAQDLENELAPDNEDHLDELPPTEEEEQRNIIVQGRLRRFGLETPQRIQYTIEERIGEEFEDFALIDNVAVFVASTVRRWAEAHGEQLPVRYISRAVRRREDAVREIMHQGLIRFGSEIAGELVKDGRLFNGGKYEAIEVPEDFGDDEDDDDDDDDNPPYGGLGPKPPGDNDDDDDDDDDPPDVPRPPDPELFIYPEEYEQALEEYNREHGTGDSSHQDTASPPKSSPPAAASSSQRRRYGRPTPADRRAAQADRRATQAARRAKRPAHSRSRGGDYEAEALARTFCDIDGCRAPLQMPMRPCGHRCGKTGHVICIARKYNGAEKWDCEPCLLNREWGKVPRMWMLDQKFAEEDRRSAAAGSPSDDETRLNDERNAGVETSLPVPPPSEVTKPLPSSPPSKREAPPARTRSTTGLNTRAILEAELRRVKGLKAICDIAACPGLDYAPTHECDQDCGKLAHTPCMAMTNQGPDWRCVDCEPLVREKRRRENEALRERAKGFAKDHAEDARPTRCSRRNLGRGRRASLSPSNKDPSQHPLGLAEPTRSSAAKAKRAALEADIAQAEKAKKPVSVKCDAPGCRRFDYAPTHECDQDCGKIAHTICMGRYSSGSSWTCPSCQDSIDKAYREAREAEDAQWEKGYADDDPSDPRPGPPILKGRFLDQLEKLDAWLARRKARLAGERQKTEKDGAGEGFVKASVGTKRKAPQVSSPPSSLSPSPPSRPQTPPARTRSLRALERLHRLENEILRAELAKTPIIAIKCDIPDCSGFSYAPTHECDQDCGKLGHTTCMARASKGSQWRCEECDAPIREKRQKEWEEASRCCEFRGEEDHPVFSPYTGSGFPWHHLRRHEEYLQRKRREKGVPDPGDEADEAAEFYAVRRRKAAFGRGRLEGGKRKRGVTTLEELIKARSKSGDAKRKGRTTTVREVLAASSKRKAARVSSPPPSKRNRNSTGTSRPARRRNTSTIVHPASSPPAPPPPNIHIRCDVPGCETQYAPPGQACEARCGKKAHETCVQYFYHTSKWLCPNCSLTEHGVGDRGERYRGLPPQGAGEEEEEAASALGFRLSIPSTIKEVDEDTNAERQEPKTPSPPKPTASPLAKDANRLSPFSASLQSSATEQSLAGLEVCPIPMCLGFKSKPSRECGGGCGKKGHPACVRRFYEGATWKCITCRNQGSELLGLGKRKANKAELFGEGEGDDGKEDAELSEPRRSQRLRKK